MSAVLVSVCVPCANGDHSSHDDHEGFGGWDMLDCKATSDDGREQCMCRATMPSEDKHTTPEEIDFDPNLVELRRPYRFLLAAGGDPSRIVDGSYRRVVVLPDPLFEDVGEVLAWALNNGAWPSGVPHGRPETALEGC